METAAPPRNRQSPVCGSTRGPLLRRTELGSPGHAEVERATELIAFVLVAVFAQIFRHWRLLHAVGVHASFFDPIAVLIAVVTLDQLPVGSGLSAAAAVLILGRDGSPRRPRPAC